MGHGGTFHVRAVADALSALWLLRMTREDASQPAALRPAPPYPNLPPPRT
jgi:hypothetical protein